MNLVVVAMHTRRVAAARGRGSGKAKAQGVGHFGRHGSACQLKVLSTMFGPGCIARMGLVNSGLTGLFVIVMHRFFPFLELFFSIKTMYMIDR